MKERPIICSSDSVRAILAGNKTQTRRVIKTQPGDVRWTPVVVGKHFGWINEHGYPLKNPYGETGDRLWVKESHQLCEIEPGKVAAVYRASAEDGFDYVYENGTVARLQIEKWRSPMFMPKAASRLTLEVTEIRVERLQEISETDAVAEGCSAGGGVVSGPMEPYETDGYTAVEEYAALWGELNAKRGYPWESNCWVWVVSFKRIAP